MNSTAADPQPHTPPTIFVVHPRERSSKCSIEPLRDRAGFVFWKFPHRGPETLDGYVRLGMGGPLIGPDDAESGLLVLDGTWRLAARMEPDFTELPVRSLPVLQREQWTVPKTHRLIHSPLRFVRFLILFVLVVDKKLFHL